MKVFTRQNIGAVLGPLLFCLILFIPDITGLQSSPRAVLAVTLWTATWWVTEPIPIPATSFLPLLLLPLTGGTDEKTATMAYGNPIVFMYMGGFIIALAIEKWNLHKRIALTILRYVGTSSKRIVLGVAIATAFLSMWISNAATALMMLPIALALISEVKERKFLDGKSLDNFAKSLLLTVAYAASIGGLATIIGSVPNAVLAGIASTVLDQRITFANWFMFGFPITVVLLVLMYFYMTKIQFKVTDDHISTTFARDELKKLGPMSREEKYVGIVFLVAGVLWISSGFLPAIISSRLTDTVISMLGATALFLLPSTKKKEKLLAWEDMKKLPWGLLVLFGGGMSLAAAFEDSKLTEWFGEVLGHLDALPYLLIVIVLTAAVLAMTEIMSNTATSNMIIPITVGLAMGIGVAPYGLMAAVALAASCAFMLPIATPPNAAVFSSDYLTIETMVKAGFWMNVFSIIVIVLAVYFLQPILFDF
ncbi:DASS family sodium-coupled anion symporter [Virgibacillus sp. 179-BFC.A HS]|uniref:Sodium-dependent dicarboxylate transporter SdcS n=1 Tax=Tigheibacillus jepli TaxID=3035914 RepID=A0ABU5CDT9_9BACI|nr:DASS family sodium-coupled anion symporter [Virgibacillus sp. 179-BFC.A HS]MDY0404171.1 DASS family sodium-coupled anion symporter [Virgibacillus sp. 179-BFC.A HS]